jgi:polyamine oxidase
LQGQIYDDGNLDVPAGCEGTVERVIVVGAGMAGLTAANALTTAGVDCVVLEARDRIGGRLHTVDVGGVPIDMGGSWIHTPVGNPMRRFADEAGVECRDGSAFGEISIYDRGERRLLSEQESGALLAIVFEAFPAALEELQAECGPGASAADAIDRFIAGSALGEAESRRARAQLRNAIATEFADLPERQSLRWLWNEDEYEGDFLGDVPAGGYVRLVDAMGGPAQVRLGAAVTTIDITETGVRVETADGGVETGTHVVCTLPLGVLKAGAVRFTPELPAERQAAIERLGYGYLEKLVLSFEQPFWRSAGITHMVVLSDEPDELQGFIVGQDALGAGTALVCLLCRSDGPRVLGQGDEAAAREVVGLLEEVIGCPCPEPTATATSAWAADRYALGAYASYPPGASPDDADQLAQPLFGRLLFAGEATSVSRMGYADGAMQTGIREAKRLLQQPAVRLTAR